VSQSRLARENSCHDRTPFLSCLAFFSVTFFRLLLSYWLSMSCGQSETNLLIPQRSVPDEPDHHPSTMFRFRGSRGSSLCASCTTNVESCGHVLCCLDLDWHFCVYARNWLWKLCKGGKDVAEAKQTQPRDWQTLQSLLFAVCGMWFSH